MDTFMDNLAQRLSAQEMISANTAAEAEELNQLKVQVKDYHECLEQMQNLINESTEQIRTLQIDGSEENKRTQEEIEMLFEAVNAAGEKTSEQNIRSVEELKRFISNEFDAFAAAENPDDVLRRQEEIKNILESVAAAENATSKNREAIEELRNFMAEQIESLKAKNTTDEEEQKKEELLKEELLRLSNAVRANSERTIQQNDAALVELRKFVDSKFAESKADNESIEQLKFFIEGKMQSLQQNQEESEKLEASMSGKFEETQEKMHKECVKVYRNVQAAMQEENEKQNSDLMKQMEAMKKKMTIITIAAAAAGVIGAASLVLQILSAMQIF